MKLRHPQQIVVKHLRKHKQVKLLGVKSNTWKDDEERWRETLKNIWNEK